MRGRSLDPNDRLGRRPAPSRGLQPGPARRVAGLDRLLRRGPEPPDARPPSACADAGAGMIRVNRRSRPPGRSSAAIDHRAWSDSSCGRSVRPAGFLARHSAPAKPNRGTVSSLRHGTSPSSRSPTGLPAAETSSRMRKPARRNDSCARAWENRSAAAPRRAAVASQALAPGVGTGSIAPSVSGSDSMNRTADASGRGTRPVVRPRASAQRRHGHDIEITAEVERLQAAMSKPFVLSIAGRPEAARCLSLAVPACRRIGPKSTTPRGRRVRRTVRRGAFTPPRSLLGYDEERSPCRSARRNRGRTP